MMPSIYVRPELIGRTSRSLIMMLGRGKNSTGIVLRRLVPEAEASRANESAFELADLGT